MVVATGVVVEDVDGAGVVVVGAAVVDEDDEDVSAGVEEVVRDGADEVVCGDDVVQVHAGVAVEELDGPAAVVLVGVCTGEVVDVDGAGVVLLDVVGAELEEEDVLGGDVVVLEGVGVVVLNTAIVSMGVVELVVFKGDVLLVVGAGVVVLLVVGCTVVDDVVGEGEVVEELLLVGAGEVVEELVVVGAGVDVELVVWQGFAALVVKAGSVCVVCGASPQ